MWQFAFCSVPNPCIRVRILRLKSFSFNCDYEWKIHFILMGQLEVPGPGCFLKSFGVLVSKISPVPQGLDMEPCAGRTRHEGASMTNATNK